jgi:hypothetical protein
VLAAVGPGGQSDGWLEHMRKLLKLSRRVIDER